MKKYIFLLFAIMVAIARVYGHIDFVKTINSNTISTMTLLLLYATVLLWSRFTFSLLARRFTAWFKDTAWVVAVLTLSCFFYCWWLALVFLILEAITYLTIDELRERNRNFFKASFYFISANLLLLSMIVIDFGSRYVENAILAAFAIIVYSAFILFLQRSRKRIITI